MNSIQYYLYIVTYVTSYFSDGEDVIVDEDDSEMRTSPKRRNSDSLIENTVSPSSLSISVPSPKIPIRSSPSVYTSAMTLNGQYRYPPSWMSGVAGMLPFQMATSGLPVMAYHTQSGHPFCWNVGQLGHLPSVTAKTTSWEPVWSIQTLTHTIIATLIYHVTAVYWILFTGVKCSLFSLSPLKSKNCTIANIYFT